jgi:hypothetical protein
MFNRLALELNAWLTLQKSIKCKWMSVTLHVLSNYFSQPPVLLSFMCVNWGGQSASDGYVGYWSIMTSSNKHLNASCFAVVCVMFSIFDNPKSPVCHLQSRILRHSYRRQQWKPTTLVVHTMKQYDVCCWQDIFISSTWWYVRAAETCFIQITSGVIKVT